MPNNLPERIGLLAHQALGRDVHHRRRRALHHGREGGLQGQAVAGRGAGRLGERRHLGLAAGGRVGAGGQQGQGRDQDAMSAHEVSKFELAAESHAFSGAKMAKLQVRAVRRATA
jgi:hypothetical protein